MVFPEFEKGAGLLGNPFRAVIVKRGGEIIYEKRWEEEVPQNIYSHTKSFTATAVGMLVSEGKLKTSDRIADLLPEVREWMSEGFEEVRVRDALTMSSGLDQALLMSAQREKGIGSPDYLRYLVSQPIRKKPGSTFHYSNGDTYLCARAAEKAAGTGLYEFLMERLFEPLGIPAPMWKRDPMGHAFPASDLWLTVSDMMKLGELYLKRGVWEHRQILDPTWIKLATSRHIETGDDHPWASGYGFQFWMCPYPDAYRADGAYGQFSIVLPSVSTVIGVQCRYNDCMRKIMDLLGTGIIEKIL